jgi:hypothetical protein
MTVFRKPTKRDFYQALERAARAFVGAALALYPAQAIIENISGTSDVDVDLAKKAIVAGCVAGISFLWRFFLPDLGRSLPPSPAADNPPNEAVAAAEAGEPAPPEAA